MPSFMHIVRLSEDYIPEPSASSQGPLYKQNLLLQTSAKNEWVLVRVLFESSSTPIWIPKRLVTKAKPGFYRLRADYEWNSGASKKKGDIIKVSYVNEDLIPLPLHTSYDLGPRIIELIDGTPGTELINACWLEPVDVPTDPPNTGPSANQGNIQTPGLLKSLVASITRKRRNTIGASDDGLPPYPHGNTGFPEEK